jgi:hypothetical protein
MCRREHTDSEEGNVRCFAYPFIITVHIQIIGPIIMPKYFLLN